LRLTKPISQRRTWVLIASAFGVSGALASVGVFSPNRSLEAGASGSTLAAAERWNIVSVVIDATSAAHLSLYGYSRNTSPELDTLAAEATVFERAYSQAPLTLPSTASFLSGRYPADSLSRDQVREPRAVRWPGELRYRTLAFSENPWVSPGFGFGADFDDFQVVTDSDGDQFGRRRVGNSSCVFAITPDSSEI
jgi:hypothetical protein